MNPNLNFLLDIALLLGGAAYLFTLVRLRAKRKALLSPYKPDSKAYNSIKASLSTQRLIIVIAAITLVIAKTIFDVRAIMQTEGNSALSTILFILAFATFLSTLIAIAIFRKYKK